MTVHEFLGMFVANIGSVDLADTNIMIRTPDGDYQPYAFDWGEFDKDTLILDVLAVEDDD